jgi:hypothetical protein
LDEYGWDNLKNAIRDREAAYLAAIASRRKAKNVDALEEARTFIREALKRDTPGQPVDLRFISELLAINTRKVYFAYFRARPREEKELVKQLIDDIEELIPKAEAKLSQAFSDPVQLRVAQWVLVQCYTNLFTLVLIRVDAYSEQLVSPLQKDRIAKFDAVIRETELEDPYPIVVCRLMKIVTYTTSAEIREELCDAVMARIDAADDDLRGETSMPYEKHRREVFKHLVNRFR